jgi:CspA family cold shock protein
MEKGTVKFYNETKGFGFIQPTTAASDVRPRHRPAARWPHEPFGRSKVSFDTAEDRRTGKMAVNNISAA